MVGLSLSLRVLEYAAGESRYRLEASPRRMIRLRKPATERGVYRKSSFNAMPSTEQISTHSLFLEGDSVPPRRRLSCGGFFILPVAVPLFR